MAVDPFARPDVVGQVFEALESLPEDALKDKEALLKRLRNSLIGNRQRKRRLCTTSAFLDALKTLLLAAALPLSLRIQVATILGVAPLPASEALVPLFQLQIPAALASVMLETRQDQPSSSSSPPDLATFPLLESSLAALRNICKTLMVLVGPPMHDLSVLGDSIDIYTPGVVTQRTFSTASQLTDADGSLAHSTNKLTRDLLDSVFKAPILASLVRALYLCAKPYRGSWTATHMPLLHNILAAVCDLLGRCVYTSHHQSQVIDCYLATHRSHGLQSPSTSIPLESILLHDLVNLLERIDGSAQEPVLLAISALVRQNSTVASRTQTISTTKGLHAVGIISRSLESLKPSQQLAAAICITNLYKAVNPQRELHFTPALRFLPVEDVRTTMITLLRLMSPRYPAHITTSAAFTLSYLVSDDEVDQIRACELGALPRLEALLKSSIINSPAHPTASDLETQATLRESALLTTAALSLASEKNRKGLIDANLLGHIVAMLSDSESRVRAAACQCARALSRSGGALRTHLIEAGAARPLFTLLGWQQSDVIVITAAATLANLLIESSAMKELLVSEHLMSELVAPVTYKNPVARLYCLLALKNLAYWAESPLKRLLMENLTWEHLVFLCHDPNQDIRAQALNIFRNIACIKQEDVADAVHNFGTPKFLSMMETILASPSEQILIAALNILQNVTQSQACKVLILNQQPILERLKALINHRNVNVCVPAIWSTTTLARRDQTQHKQTNENAMLLKSLGFEEILRSLLSEQDLSLEVRERLSECLEHFDAATFYSR